eukprot:CAMPEP_0179126930 /NCGR_PEP_ID=MMETSP0796-20121207/60104_1 /TAXON_ID=73915 /ORGANISM="Pyrodinium bahamense, Strain pbaha01" /LENGTH=227 /DNA_ID=CAMNT_0020825697 /DNA_START=208 /DNA_END=888 /DNA_ORIENTATION=+
MVHLHCGTAEAHVEVLVTLHHFHHGIIHGTSLECVPGAGEKVRLLHAHRHHVLNSRCSLRRRAGELGDQLAHPIPTRGIACLAHASPANAIGLPARGVAPPDMAGPTGVRGEKRGRRHRGFAHAAVGGAVAILTHALATEAVGGTTRGIATQDLASAVSQLPHAALLIILQKLVERPCLPNYGLKCLAHRKSVIARCVFLLDDELCLGGNVEIQRLPVSRRWHAEEQ